MARLGYVYGNFMVNLQLKNEKLLERGISIVQRIAHVNHSTALATLHEADMKVPVALVMLCAKVGKQEAAERLARAKDSVRGAIEAS